jgi:hypothetical protein
MMKWVFKPRLNLFDMGYLSISISATLTDHWLTGIFVVLAGAVVSALCEVKAGYHNVR